MKRIIVGEKECVSEWVAARMPGTLPWVSGYEAIGLEQGGRLVAGVVVDGFVRNARCSIHCAGEGKNWLNREFLQFVFTYVFNQMGCNVVVNPVSSANTASLKFTAHLGFKEACRIKDGYADGDLVIFELQRSECRWIRR